MSHTKQTISHNKGNFQHDLTDYQNYFKLLSLSGTHKNFVYLYIVNEKEEQQNFV